MNRLITFPSIVQGIKNAQAQEEEARRKAEEESKIDMTQINAFSFSGQNADIIAERRRRELQS